MAPPKYTPVHCARHFKATDKSQKIDFPQRYLFFCQMVEVKVHYFNQESHEKQGGYVDEENQATSSCCLIV